MVPADHFLRLGLLDDVRHLADAGRDIARERHDAVLVGILLGHVLHAEHASSVSGEHVDHLLQAGHGSVDQIVREMNHEGRVADHGPRAQNGVAQSQRRRLADVDARGPARQDPAQRIQQFLFALSLQHGLEFGIAVEVILDRPLGTSGDEYQCLRAGGKRLIDRILNQRFVDDGQHFLGAGLGDGQKSSAASGYREYGGLYGFVLHGEIVADFDAPRRRRNLTP